MKTSEAWMSFGGIDSRDVDVLVRQEPVFTAPVMRVIENATISGRSGKRVIQDGTYEPITVSVKLASKSGADMSMIRAWLTGSGYLIFGDQPNRRWNAYVVKEFKFQPVMRTDKTEFEVSFQCDPFAESITAGVWRVSDLVQSTGNLLFIPEGNVVCYPVVKFWCEPGYKVTFHDNDRSYLDATDTSATLQAEKKCENIFFDCMTGISYRDSEWVEEYRPKDDFDVIIPHIVEGYFTGAPFALAPGHQYRVLAEGEGDAFVQMRWRWL